MTSKLALLLLSASLCLRASWGQEDGEEIQTEETFFEEVAGNGFNESAVAGVFYRNLLYVAINTGEVDVGGDTFGGTDLVVKSFDDELEEEVVVQLGGDGNDMITAITAPISVTDAASDIVIVGSTTSDDDHLFENQINGTGGMDWFIARLDRQTLEVADEDGVILAFVDGTEFEAQQATAVAITPDGDYVVAGWTAGDFFADNVGANNTDDNDGSVIGLDFWVAKIDSDLTDYIWSVQLGTTAYDQPTAVVVGENNNVYVVGNIDDFGEILTDAQEEEFPSMFVYCLDGDDGSTVWFTTDDLGFMPDEGKAYGAVLTTDGDALYVSGNTKGIIDGYDGESTGADELFIVSFDIEAGDVNWVYQSEGNATAFGTGGIVLAEDGLTPIISGTAFGNHFNLSSTYWVGGSGDMIAAMIDTEELEVIKYYTATAENNNTRQDPLALVKVEDEEYGVYMIGTNNGEWLEDSEPDLDDTNYLILKVVLDTPPEVEEDGDDGRDFPYWYVGIPVFAIGGVLFLVAYKWAAYSQAAKAKLATQV